MAQEIKNTFLKSKMNKDLDDRILPNGEYRDARNISVGRSEDNDVGALENIIGNALVTGTDIGNGLTIIGVLADNSTDNIFVFLTDYTDPNPENPTNAPSSSKHYIYFYNNASESYTLMVKGEFLNFSTTNRIIGVNLIENLLFWTDNRNQPRKININLARAFNPGGLATNQGDYYTKEHQISVAKYNPYDTIKLYKRVDLKTELGATVDYFEIDGDRVFELLPFVGATVVSPEAGVNSENYVKVESVILDLTGTKTRINVYKPFPTAPSQNDFISLIISTMTSKNEDDSWPGDPDYLEDKFVRFSYRFKFDDNEYSLMAPFTQIAYIPKQNGYFLNGDEDSAYQSTIVDFMENLVQNIGLIIPLPSSGNKLISDYKIAELEILFRESDKVAVKVLDSILVNKIVSASGANSEYVYEYQSRKPYRTLPEAQTVRVYDKVPVKAFAQETSGNRIIYGNFKDQYTPPQNINYNCKIDPKSTTGAYDNFIEYPKHTVKRNRNYQVGFVLSDKFGRQSPVILSSVDSGVSTTQGFYSGSTIYSAYDIDTSGTDVKLWAGDAIKVLVNEPITSEIDAAAGTPGLYAIENKYAPNTGEGFAIATWVGTTITDTTYTFRQAGGAAPPLGTYPNNQNIPRVGDYMRGAYTDFVKVTNVSGPTGPAQYTVTTDGRVNDIYLREDNLPAGTPDLKFTYNINDLGWYSYKIVVKQTEQDYYNVYLPGILNGYPGQSGNEQHSVTGGIDEGIFPNEINLTAHTVLFNDNINKIPRDLAEVGPDQKQYRSSVVLYGRVENGMNDTGTSIIPTNSQYFPRLNYAGKSAISHTSTAIAQARDFNMGFSELSTDEHQTFTGGSNGNKVFYEISSNPLIARISTTEKSIGQPNIDTVNDQGGSTPSAPFNMLPYLAVYETAPVESLLDIYWETTSTGLIVDLNADVASTNTGVAGFQGLDWDFDEESASAGQPVTSWFTPVDNQGQTVTSGVTASLTSQTVNVNGVATPVTDFELVPGPVGSVEEGNFQIRYIPEGIAFLENSETSNVYSFEITVTETATQEQRVIELPGVPRGFGALKNIQPFFNPIPDDIEISPSQTTIIKASDWTTANPDNGSGLASQDGLQLKYSFEPFTGFEDSIPSNWTMDENTGILTQAPGVNPLGTYKINLILSDANLPGGGDGSDYQSLTAEQTEFTIKMLPDQMNAGVLYEGGSWDTCKVLEEANNGQGVLSPEDLYNTVAMVYYICEGDDLTGGTGLNPTNMEVFFNNGIPNPANNIPAAHPVTGGGQNSNVYAHRIGTESHKKGALTFSSNVNFPRPTLNSPEEVPVLVTPAVTYYYRYTGETQWRPLPRSIEKNRAGFADYRNKLTLPGSNEVATPYQDAPAYDRYDINQTPDYQDYPNSNNAYFRYIKNVSVSSDIWTQSIRAYDYNDFGGTHPTLATTPGEEQVGIEYAIVFQGMTVGFANQNISLRSTAWLVVDDFNFPKCIPWQGVNAFEANGGVNEGTPETTTYNLFKYHRSTGGDTSNAWEAIGTNEIWGRNAYGDYNDQFYTNETDFITYVPSSPFINIKLDRQLQPDPAVPLNTWSTTDKFTNIPGEYEPDYAIDLQWVVGLDTGTGLKTINTNSTSGVSAIQTSQKPFPDPVKLEYPNDKGTLRIYRLVVAP